MNRSYTLNSVCTKFISNEPVFRKIGVQIFEVLLYIKTVCATNTRPFGEVGGKSPIKLYRQHILLKLKIKMLLRKNSWWISFHFEK